MTIRHSDSIPLRADACECHSKVDQDTRDKIDAWLDHYSAHFGVARGAIVSEMARVNDAATTNVTSELIQAAAERLSRPGAYTIPGLTNAPAQYHNPGRVNTDARRVNINDSDEAFRAMLTLKLDGTSATDGDVSSDDVAFRAMLARRAGGAS